MGKLRNFKDYRRLWVKGILFHLTYGIVALVLFFLMSWLTGLFVNNGGVLLSVIFSLIVAPPTAGWLIELVNKIIRG